MWSYSLVKKKNEIEKVERRYRGFTVTAFREQSLGGDELLYYHIFRDSDGWCMEDSFEDSEEKVLSMVNILCGHVDDFYEHPEDYDDGSIKESEKEEIVKVEITPKENLTPGFWFARQIMKQEESEHGPWCIATLSGVTPFLTGEVVVIDAPTDVRLDYILRGKMIITNPDLWEFGPRIEFPDDNQESSN